MAMPWEMALLAGWDVLAAVLIGWTWLALGRLGPHETAELAKGEDPAAGWTDLLLVCASVASLGAVALVLLKVSGGRQVSGRVTLAVVSVVLSWALVHTIV
jgi:uncharacterized membrane protein